MKFDILDVVDLSDYSIKEGDKNCEMCGSKKDTRMAILRYSTNQTPEENEIMCEKCLKREGWDKLSRVGGS